MKRLDERVSIEQSLIHLPRDIFEYAFINNCKLSTFYILSMVCKDLYSMFKIDKKTTIINFSIVFLKEDNPLWYKNPYWYDDISAEDILINSGEKCLKLYTKIYKQHIPDIYRIAASKGYIKLMHLIDNNKRYIECMKKQLLLSIFNNLTNGDYKPQLELKYNLFHEFIFFEYALSNQQFDSCDYIYNVVCKRMFRYHGLNEIIERYNLPIISWEYMIKTVYIDAGHIADIYVDIKPELQKLFDNVIKNSKNNK